MAVKIRLSRIGTTNRPFYRIIATDARNKRDGAMLANVGTYDPVEGIVVQFHEDIYQAWLSKGAIATDSAKKIYRLYKKSGLSPIIEATAVKTVIKKTVEEAV
ncbi:MAG TPA: 30S ribosomal protein S16 [Candidatus Babeliales bacterium]|nr:30S ribosomal protein S16 [Candidatus Babeliales bacterium]